MADPFLSGLTADIVSSYVGENAVPADQLSVLIQATYKALADLDGAEVATEAVRQPPAVPIKRSITPEFLISLEDGNKYKSLKRHLRTKYNMSPEDYRGKWGLPKDYPMVAPAYAAARSVLAKSMGLGRGGAQVNKPASAKPARKPRTPKA